MNTLQDCITYVRRIIKSPSDSVISDALIIDYINRFWLMDVDARIQLFDLKTTYQFQTVPGVDRYNMPLYNVQFEPGLDDDTPQRIASYPVYQGFMGPAKVNGIEIPFTTLRSTFFSMFPNVVQNLPAVAVGSATPTANYNIQLPILSNTAPTNPPVQAIIRGHVDITGIIKTGNNEDPIINSDLDENIPTTSISSAVYFTSTDATGEPMVVADSGQLLNGSYNHGLLMNVGQAPYGNTRLTGTYSQTENTINYLTGQANVTFPSDVPEGVNINAQVYYFQSGLPRSVLFYNNVLTLRSVPSQAWLVELDAYLSPAAFLSSEQAIPFAYMTEYIARGAARKILSDTGDVEQFNFYEGLFKEQEMLVWKRSQRQFTATRTPNIYSSGMMGGSFGGTGLGGGGI